MTFLFSQLPTPLPYLCQSVINDFLILVLSYVVQAEGPDVSRPLVLAKLLIPSG